MKEKFQMRGVLSVFLSLLVVFCPVTLNAVQDETAGQSIVSDLNKIDRLLAAGALDDAETAIEAISFRLAASRISFDGDRARLSDVDVLEAYVLYYRGRVEYKRGLICAALHSFRVSYSLVSDNFKGEGGRIAVVSLSNLLRLYSEIGDVEAQVDISNRIVKITSGGIKMDSNVMLSVMMQLLIAYSDLSDVEKSKNALHSFSVLLHSLSKEDGAQAWEGLGAALLAQAEGHRSAAMRSYANSLVYFDDNPGKGGSVLPLFLANYSLLLRNSGQVVAADAALAKAEDVMNSYTIDVNGFVSDGLRRRAGQVLSASQGASLHVCPDAS